MHKGAMSKSFSSLNTMDLLSINHNQLQHGKQQPQRTSNLSLNRYSNRSKVRRNHSLSPLRFGAKKSKTNNGDEQSEPTSPTIMTAENSPKEIRKYKSEQQLFFDENISMASFEEDSTTTSQNNDLSSEIDPDKCSLLQTEVDDDNNNGGNGDDGGDEPEDHLLAPSKVAKSQDAFKQIFFPVDVREKPLMSKEELNKIKNKKTMVKSKSIGWAEQAANSMNDQSLRVDYLSHIRRSSASPEQKQREKELNNLNNTKKFRCYQDFWENKTKEIMDKKDRFEMKQSQQSQQLVNNFSNQNSSTSGTDNSSSSLQDTMDFASKSRNGSISSTSVQQQQQQPTTAGTPVSSSTGYQRAPMLAMIHSSQSSSLTNEQLTAHLTEEERQILQKVWQKEEEFKEIALKK